MRNNIIAITASLKCCSLAIRYGDDTFQLTEEVDAAANLAFLLQELITKHCVDLKKIDGVITAAGPGSFTGIRTAQSLAKAIALTLEIPAASVNYFDVIEHIANINSNSSITHRIVVIKSEKDHAYFKKNYANQIEMGIASYDDIINEASEKNAELIGEEISEIISKQKQNFVINNFRDAVNLLDFSDRITESSRITPLYINAAC